LAKKNNPHRGIYTRKGKLGLSYGIDYIHPLTGQRVKKILKKVTSVEQALKLRSIEIADAARGAIIKPTASRKGPMPYPSRTWLICTANGPKRTRSLGLLMSIGGSP